MYKLLIRPIAFLFTPEKAHHLVLGVLNIIAKTPILSNLVYLLFRFERKSLNRNYLGLDFNNQVGLAAGMDKDGKYLPGLSLLGFGFIEVGTITPKAQPGNPKPRLFRLKKDEALINRMGFNNNGVESLIKNLKRYKNYIDKKGIIIGGNIGKNKITPNSEAVDDYIFCFEALFDYVDYFVVNVSSPNTPNLRELQEKEPLQDLLQKLQDINQKKDHPKPILLKIAPDLTAGQLDDIIEIVDSTNINGLIATNTTISRDGLIESKSSLDSIGNGGLSGKPLKSRSTEIIKYIYNKANGSIFIIGVGGINSEQTTKEKLDEGASLIQVFSGLVYEGPWLVKKIKKNI